MYCCAHALPRGRGKCWRQNCCLTLDPGMSRLALPQCSAGPANCDEPEADNCGCAKCVSGYSLNPSTKQCEECLGTPAGCSVHDLNACTCQVCEDGYSLDTTTRQCQECPGILDCVGWELNGCTCQDCDNGSVPANGGLQCDACFTTCDVFVSNSCDCDTTDYY